ncbi:SEC-C metal-binding domain-containing protein [Nocardiopsis ansamitocini]|uniref:SEC-C metal-binding domain-containing protein n=1 Tax=Nocardiopsis ansamitocini TaxID=1670832 RepID=UPI003D7FC451
MAGPLGGRRGQRGEVVDVVSAEPVPEGFVSGVGGAGEGHGEGAFGVRWLYCKGAGERLSEPGAGEPVAPHGASGGRRLTRWCASGRKYKKCCGRP